MSADEEREFEQAMSRYERALGAGYALTAVRHLNAAWAIFKAAGHTLAEFPPPR